MRRKNRKWVATAVVIYLFIMWSAYRWSIHQIPDDGPILAHLEKEAVRKGLEQRAEEARKQIAPPTGEARLNAAGPAYVAARYDATHVVFMVTTDTESRFPVSAHTPNGSPTRISAPARPAAPLAGLQELWEPDSQSLHFFPKIIQTAQPGDQWTMNVDPSSTIAVAVERPVIAPVGCSIAIGFLASVPPDQQSAFAASRSEYFAVRHAAVESANPPVNLPAGKTIGAIIWPGSPALTTEIETQLNARMMQELARIDASLRANAHSPGATASEMPVGNVRPYLKEWIRADRALTRGEGALDYDIRAFRLAPDAQPRLYVRARWKLSDAPVFLMSAWFKTETPKRETLKPETPKTEADIAPDKAEGPKETSAAGSEQVVLLSADSSWSAAMRNGEAPASLGETLDFQTILNEFDADHDGWAELLIHSQDAASTTIGLYLYTDVGLVPMKTPLRRDAQSPESCIEQPE
jgi:hypothetical protein